MKILEVDELKDREKKSISVAGKSLVAVRVGDQVHVIDSSCPHQGGPLAEGTLDEKCQLTCPWHGWKFDPVTGHGDKGVDVAHYPVEVKSDGIYLEIEEEKVETHTVSDVLAETMVEWGVTHVFGMVGHSNLGMAEAIRKLEKKGKLTFIGIRHEGAAAFACSGFAKATGRPAACLTIAGPGATNLLTGLWDAKMDRAPVLALTGQINTQVLGPGSFQEIDLANAFHAVSGWSQTVLTGSSHAELMSLALKSATVNRDVSHLILPDESQVFEVPKDVVPGRPKGRLSQIEISPAPSDIEKAVSLISKSRRPAIIVGYGARGRMEEVEALAEKINAPILTTFKAKGLISDYGELGAGVLGRSGTSVASNLMADSDLLVVFGATFAAHTGIDPDKPIIQVDLDRMMLGKFHPVTLPIWGEISTTCKAVSSKLPSSLECENQRERIQGYWKDWRGVKRSKEETDNGTGINSAILFKVLGELVSDDAVMAVDVGNNTYSFGKFFECKNQKVLMSGYLGSIGFGFPAAMGAWAAYPEKQIIAVTGDGGFGQYMAEFTTAVKYKMNITHILLNNSELGKISKEQRSGHFEVWQTDLKNPNFSEYAKNCGGLGLRVTDSNDLKGAMQEALSYKGPAMLEVITDSLLF